ncbi:membrane or secreted protein [Rufibacter sp. LB8]|uniref:membrane or secreted protein n=1 Tax=Rufibacter sp. LB8 TaxID=2777781 RepID=UPI00178C794A|nr:membrane or secreted protein [Rufibacter sp. LB8]
MSVFQFFSLKTAVGLVLLGWLGFFMSDANISSGFLSTDFAQTQTAPAPADLEGAWQLLSPAAGKNQTATVVKTLADGFFSVAHFDKAGKKFLGTYGGTYTLSEGKFQGKFEFHTFDSTKVGQSILGTVKKQNGAWQLTLPGEAQASQTWVKGKEKTARSPLAGAWRISHRLGQDGQLRPMVQGPRKTIKILSGDRFQWIAFNSETAAFSGTGGGTYTAQDGKYTEHIEFFSRDSSRVGMQITFNFEMKDGRWQHTGQSSTGSPVHEVWQRLAQ